MRRAGWILTICAPAWPKMPQRGPCWPSGGNNETGAVQPVAEAAEIGPCCGRDLLVCDAVQAFSRIPCSFAATGADILFLSSHKLGGPKGAGALAYLRRDLMPARR